MNYACPPGKRGHVCHWDQTALAWNVADLSSRHTIQQHIGGEPLTRSNGGPGINLQIYSDKNWSRPEVHSIGKPSERYGKPKGHQKGDTKGKPMGNQTETKGKPKGSHPMLWEAGTRAKGNPLPPESHFYTWGQPQGNHKGNQRETKGKP